MCRNEPTADYDPNVSAYLQRPLRTYEEALRDVLRARRNRERLWKSPVPLNCSDPTRSADPHDNEE